MTFGLAVLRYLEPSMVLCHRLLSRGCFCDCMTRVQGDKEPLGGTRLALAAPISPQVEYSPSEEGGVMPIVQVPAQLTVEHLMAAVKQLSPAELHEFTQQLAAWQQHNGQPAEEEAALLARIQANSRLPDAEQRRYERLRRKCERRTLTERELTEYQVLLQQLEARNVKRIEALIVLAQRRGTTLRGMMAELGLHSEANAE